MPIPRQQASREEDFLSKPLLSGSLGKSLTEMVLLGSLSLMRVQLCVDQRKNSVDPPQKIRADFVAVDLVGHFVPPTSGVV
jgi:hypothetical protein